MGAGGAHLSPHSWIPAGSWGRKLQGPWGGKGGAERSSRTVRAEGVLCLSPTAALPDAQSLIHQVPSCGGPVTFVWAGGHV